MTFIFIIYAVMGLAILAVFLGILLQLGLLAGLIAMLFRYKPVATWVGRGLDGSLSALVWPVLRAWTNIRHPKPDGRIRSLRERGDRHLSERRHVMASLCFRSLIEEYEPHILSTGGIEGPKLLSDLSRKAAIASAGEDGRTAEAALSWARRAIVYDPENPEAHEVLGLLHLWLGQREEASRAFKQAMESLRGIDAPDPVMVERIRSGARRAGVKVGVRVRTADDVPVEREFLPESQRPERPGHDASGNLVRFGPPLFIFVLASTVTQGNVLVIGVAIIPAGLHLWLASPRRPRAVARFSAGGMLLWGVVVSLLGMVVTLMQAFPGMNLNASPPVVASPHPVVPVSR